MNNLEIFEVVKIGSLFLPVLSTLILFFLVPWPKAKIGRIALSILIPWALIILYMGTIFNSAGINAGIELGMNNPEMQFDNNTIASSMLGGWILPSFIVSVSLLVQRFMRNVNAVTK